MPASILKLIAEYSTGEIYDCWCDKKSEILVMNDDSIYPSDNECSPTICKNNECHNVLFGCDEDEIYDLKCDECEELYCQQCIRDCVFEHPCCRDCLIYHVLVVIVELIGHHQCVSDTIKIIFKMEIVIIGVLRNVVDVVIIIVVNVRHLLNVINVKMIFVISVVLIGFVQIKNVMMTYAMIVTSINITINRYVKHNTDVH